MSKGSGGAGRGTGRGGAGGFMSKANATYGYRSHGAGIVSHVGSDGRIEVRAEGASLGSFAKPSQARTAIREYAKKQEQAYNRRTGGTTTRYRQIDINGARPGEQLKLPKRAERDEFADIARAARRR